MNIEKSMLVILSVFLIFVLIMGSASAVDENAAPQAKVTVGVDDADEILAVEESSVGNASGQGLGSDECSDLSVDESNSNEVLKSSSSDSVLGSNIQNTFSDIRHDIVNANPGATLYLSGKYVRDDAEWIIINANNLTIVGTDDCILDARGMLDIFKVYSSNVTLKNIVFTNGKATNGGAIEWRGSGGVVDNCRFVNNTATENGGAINWIGSEGTVTNSYFEKNSAQQGGAIYYSRSSSGVGTGAISNSGFANNSATENGGAIFVDNFMIDVANSSFIDNKVRSSNLSSIDESVQMTFNFEGYENYINAISSGKDAVSFVNVTYWNGNVVNSDVVTPIWSGHEAGINIILELYDSDGVLAINVTLVTDANGQAVYDYSNSFYGFYNYKAYHMDDSYYSYIETSGNFTVPLPDLGGFNLIQYYINWASENSTVYLQRNYTFTVGKDENLTDGIVVNKRNLTIDGNGYAIDARGLSRIFKIAADKVILKNVSLINAKKDSDYGGAIFWEGSDGVIAGCSFVNNSANRGGAIYLHDVVEMVIKDSSFIDNKAGIKLSRIDENSVLNFTVEEGENYINAIYADESSVSFVNVTYWNGSKVVNSDVVYPVFSSRQAGIKIALKVYSNSTLVDNVTLVTDDNGQAIYDYTKLSHGDYTYVAYHEADSYYSYNDTLGSFYYDLGDFNLIQHYITLASENSTVYLQRNYSFTSGKDENLYNGIVVNKRNLTIDGKGYIIDARGLSRIFNVLAVNVTLKNIILVHGNFSGNYSAEECGGAIYWTGNDGVVDNCRFVNCTANDHGGAIYWTGGNGVVGNSSFVNCIVRDYEHHSSDNAEGGAIYWTGGNGVVGNSSFVNCTSSSTAGAIEWRGYHGTLYNCSFMNNSAKSSGAVAWWAENSFIRNCSFVNNKAESSTGAFCFGGAGIVEDCSFVNNSCGGDGGAIYLHDRQLSVRNCSFTDNKAGNSGGAIYSRGNLNIADSSFIDNKAGSKSISSKEGNFMVTFEFTANENYINAIYSDAGSVSFANVTYWNGKVVNSDDVTPVKSQGGIGINLTVEVRDSKTDKLVDNVTIMTDSTGHIVYDFSRVSYGLYDCTIYHMADSYYDYYEIDYSFVIRESDFEIIQLLINKAGNNGVVNLLRNFTFSIDYDQNFTKGIPVDKMNLTINGNGHSINALGFVRIFNITANDVKLNNIVFINGNATNGGAVYWSGNNGVMGNCSFMNNTAQNGGAVYWSGNNGVADNCTFVKNPVAEYGGAIFLNGADVVIAGCNFVNNIANRGGAIYWNEKYNQVVDCSFADNSAKDHGGAILWMSVDGGVVDNCRFVNNFAKDGGAISLLRSLGVIGNCSFVNNSATENGGALYWTKQGTVAKCNFTNNSANLGAAIYLYDTVDRVIRDSRFIDNKATSGNLSCVDENSVLTFTFYGGENYINAIYASEASVSFVNVTYWNGNMVNSDVVTPVLSRGEAGINITLEIYSNGALIVNVTNVSDVNGQLVYDYSKLPKGAYTFKAYHADDCYYVYNETLGNFIIPKNYNIVVLNNQTHQVMVNVPVRFNATIKDDENQAIYPAGNLTFVLSNGSEIKASFEGGVWFADYTFNQVGDYMISARFEPERFIYNDSSYVLKEVFNATMTVHKNSIYDIHLDVVSGDAGENTTVTVVVPSEVSGNVIVTVNGTDYPTVKVGDGRYNATIVFSVVGKYVVNATVSDDPMYMDKISANVDIDVAKNSKCSVDIEVVLGDAGKNTNIIVTVLGDVVGNVSVNINGTVYPAVKIANGTYEVNVVLHEGNYTVNATVSDDPNYVDKTSDNITFDVKLGYNVEALDMKRGWDSPYDYLAKLVDSYGRPVKGQALKFTVNGINYDVVTDSEGIAKLTASKLAVGNYDVIVTNPLDGKNVTAKITIVARLLENKDLTKDYGSSQAYKVLVIGDDGNAVGAGQVVVMKLNGVIHNVKTDKYGYAILPINLKPMKCTVTASYHEYLVKNTIKVKRVMKMYKVSVKKGKTLVLKVKLKWSNGKAIVGKKIKFKFKGKVYNAKTNRKGIAKASVKSKVTKKLKKGKHVYKATYIKDTLKGTVYVK